MHYRQNIVLLSVVILASIASGANPFPSGYNAANYPYYSLLAMDNSATVFINANFNPENSSDWFDDAAGDNNVDGFMPGTNGRIAGSAIVSSSHARIDNTLVGPIIVSVPAGTWQVSIFDNGDGNVGWSAWRKDAYSPDGINAWTSWISGMDANGTPFDVGVVPMGPAWDPSHGWFAVAPFPSSPEQNAFNAGQSYTYTFTTSVPGYVTLWIPDQNTNDNRGGVWVEIAPGTPPANLSVNVSAQAVPVGSAAKVWFQNSNSAISTIQLAP